MTSSASDTVVLGNLGAPYGVKGWVKVNSYTEIAESIFDYTPWVLNLRGAVKEVRVEDWRHHNKGLVAKIDGVDDRDGVDALKGAEVTVLAAQMPKLPEDEFYWRDLEGMSVVNVQGYNLGTVQQMMATGANDVMVVQANSNDAFGQKERLIPFLMVQVIKQVSLEDKQILVDWDPGF